MRFEFILNTYLREFVENSINDWVNFIKSFTTPKYEQEELWKLSEYPMIIIHIHMNKSGKKKDPKKKDPKKKESPKKKNEEEEEVGDPTKDPMDFKPALGEVSEFFTKAFAKLIESVNKVSILEHGLMPFLQTNEQPNFELTEEFPWFQDALHQVTEMIEENIKGPMELLEKYKKYEYILVTKKQKKISDLFEGGIEEELSEPESKPQSPSKEDEQKRKKKKDEKEAPPPVQIDPVLPDLRKGKASIKKLREEIEHYHQAYFEIMNLSNDVVDFPIFRIMCGKIKKELGAQADKLKQSILEAISNYCVSAVDQINKTYDEMNKHIGDDPKNEKELVEIRDFIKYAPERVKMLEDHLSDVNKHLKILEDYSYPYDDKENHKYYWTKNWPLEISSSITDGSYQIQNKEIIFMQKLDHDKEAFQKSIKQFQEQFEKIKTFSDLKVAKEYSNDAFTLNDSLNK